MDFEIWDAGGDNSYFYTQRGDIARDLAVDFGPATTYSNEMGIIAWQFLIPKKLETILVKKYTNNTAKLYQPDLFLEAS